MTDSGAERAARRIVELFQKWDYRDVPILSAEDLAAIIREEAGARGFCECGSSCEKCVGKPAAPDEGGTR